MSDAESRSAPAYERQDAAAAALPAPGRPHDVGPSDALRRFMAQGWQTRPGPPARPHPVAPFAAARRDALSKRFPGETLVVPTGRPLLRSGDTDYPFRPGSDYLYLVGATAPRHVLVMRPRPGGHDATVYLPPRSDRESGTFYTDARYGELWVGPQPGPDEVRDAFGVATQPLPALAEDLASAGPATVRVLAGVDRAVDALAPPSAAESGPLAQALAELRLRKDAYEIARLEEAVAATVSGFEDVRAEIAHAMTVRRGERWLEGTFWRRARADGNDVGYASVVAGGAHAATLHWQPLTGRITPGDLVLLDMGVETDAFYTADVTRTVPVSGRFSASQRLVYQAVLEAQQAAMDAVEPGVPFLLPHRVAMRRCTEFLVEQGLLDGDVDEILEQQLHRRWTLHSTSHHLGLDVHDCIHADASAYKDGVLEEGMVITVEPGLYFQPDDALAPERLRGIGVRIEDDVLVIANGARNLSAALPREAADVETWMEKASA